MMDSVDALERAQECFVVAGRELNDLDHASRFDVHAVIQLGFAWLQFARQSPRDYRRHPANGVQDG